MNDMEKPPALEDRILNHLASNPGLKGSQIASALGAERREVNRCLHGPLMGRVRQDSTYRWYLAGASAPQLQSEAPEHQSELTDLCRYYLECLACDADQGASVFAASRFGDPDYVQLPAYPGLDDQFDWTHAEGVGALLGRARQQKAKVAAYIGYPVRLRHHRTQRWEGYFVEPVTLLAVDLDGGSGRASLNDDLPFFNFKFLRTVAAGGAVQVLEEAAQLATDLGLNNPREDQPEADELFERLRTIRPDWDWREPLDPARTIGDRSLAELDQPGIYNRAIVVLAERPNYTRGLETELKDLGAQPKERWRPTALGHWLTGEPAPVPEREGGANVPNTLIEVLPMNSEQREAVRRALTEPLTVVTGPPGTGKSQVVTNLLINAAWRGQHVLFASKNNKAVDVVESRVNGLGNRPVLLRLGANEYQQRLAQYMSTLLAGRITADDKVNYAEGLERHNEISEQLNRIDVEIQATMEARNHVDQLERSVEAHRDTLGEKLFRAIGKNPPNLDREAVKALRAAVDGSDPANRSAPIRATWPLWRKAALKRLGKAGTSVQRTAEALHLTLPVAPASDTDVPTWRAFVETLESRIAAAIEACAYHKALDALRSRASLEELAAQRRKLTEKLAANSGRLWRDYVNLTPSRLSATDRKNVGDFTAVLNLLLQARARNENPPRNVSSRYRQLLQEVSKLFTCWAVTSLSAKGRVPFEPATFDLLVIDEASQCDIASALPLLYRARRAVIIGDPQQLRHISSVSAVKEQQLQEKYSIIEKRAAWMYSVSSLFDLAASLAGPEDLVSLRDHHRSHADIIGFSNEFFYAGNLRIATRYTNLKRPSNSGPGIEWLDVRGRAVRPGNGGALNEDEARAVIDWLRELLLVRGYRGTVGVVSPFRAQVNRIEELLQADSALSRAAVEAECLVDTVHKFQGDERDIIVFSPVVAEGISAGALSFLRYNGNLFNVAVTRARGLLQVIGDMAAAGTSGIEYLEEFARYVQNLQNERRVTEESVPGDFGPEYPVVAHPERVSDWERIFYRALYAAGIRPIPQYNVEQYALDFALFVNGRRLDIEVDGERYHRSWTGELCIKDQLRNQRLMELGWEVKRFWVYEIRDRMDECVAAIEAWMKDAEKSRQDEVAEATVAGTA